MVQSLPQRDRLYVHSIGVVVTAFFPFASYYCYRIFRAHYIQLTKWQRRIAQQHYSFELCVKCIASMLLLRHCQTSTRKSVETREWNVRAPPATSDIGDRANTKEYGKREQQNKLKFKLSQTDMFE